MHLNILVSFLVTITDGKNSSNITFDSRVNNITVINVSLDGTEVTGNNTNDVVKVNASILSDALEISTIDSKDIISESTTTISKVSAQLGELLQATALDHNDEIISSLHFNTNTSRGLLYMSIIKAKYNEAVNLTKRFDEDIVTDVISELFQFKANNIMEYAYQLWVANEKDIVGRYFPPEFGAIFNGGHINIVSNDNGIPVTVSNETAIEFTRGPINRLLDESQSRSIWKCFPIWKNDKLYFKLYNIHSYWYLRTMTYKCTDGDYEVWAEEGLIDDKYYWILKPVGLNVFKIINPIHNASLSFHENNPKNAVSPLRVKASTEETCKHNIDTVPCFNEWNIVPVTVTDRKNESIHALYMSIINGNYNEAVNFTKTLEENIVTDVISKLFESGSSNIMEYAYQLWVANEKDIVARCFPPEYSTIFKGDHFKIVSNDFGTALTFSGDSEVMDERQPITGFTHLFQTNTIWKCMPVWENDTLYFNLYNIHTNFYLWVGTRKFKDGKHAVWGKKDKETDDNYWILRPMGFNTFKIINPKYNVLLSFYNKIPKNSEFVVWPWASNEDICKQRKYTHPCYIEWNIVPVLP